MTAYEAWEWLRIKFMYQGIPLIAVILLSILLVRFTKMCTSLYILFIKKNNIEKKAKYRISTVQVISWLCSIVIFSTSFIVSLIILNVPIMSFVTPVAVVGAAIAFGAQNIVKDILSGFFVITEKQYGVGDIIRISEVGSDEGTTGTVEHITLRATRIRNLKGELIVIANGSIRQVSNLSQEWSVVVLDLPLPPPPDVRPELVKNIIEKSLKNYWESNKQYKILLNKPDYLGVESIEVEGMNPHVLYRVTAKVEPGQQYETYRDIREHLMKDINANGISISNI